jgi:predicted small secreted protein
MQRVFCLGLLVALVTVLCGCNTVRGIGQDVKKAGEVIEGAAKK